MFISFARLDNISDDGANLGWIDCFHHALDAGLSSALGRKPRIFRDNQIQNQSGFAEEIMSALNTATAFVLVTTPTVLGREWVQAELARFLELSGETTSTTRSRLFVVCKAEIDRYKLPRRLQNVLGYTFYVRDGENGGSSAFRWQPPEGRAYQQLLHLVTDLSKQIEEVESQCA